MYIAQARAIFINALQRGCEELKVVSLLDICRWNISAQIGNIFVKIKLYHVKFLLTQGQALSVKITIM